MSPVDEADEGGGGVARPGDGRNTETDGGQPQKHHPADGARSGHDAGVSFLFAHGYVLVDAVTHEWADGCGPEDGGQVGLDVAEPLAEDPALEEWCPEGEGSDEDSDAQIGDRQGHEEVPVDEGQSVCPQQDEDNQQVARYDGQADDEDKERVNCKRHRYVSTSSTLVYTIGIVRKLLQL